MSVLDGIIITLGIVFALSILSCLTLAGLWMFWNAEQRRREYFEKQQLASLEDLLEGP